MKSVCMPDRTAPSLGWLLTGLSLIAGIGLNAGVALAQEADLSPFEVVYDVGNNHISAGSAVLKLTQAGDRWTYSLITKPTGVFKLTGKGNIQETSAFTASTASDSLEIKPHTYTYRQDKETRRSVDAWFDWNNNQLTYKRGSDEASESMSEPLLDRLSVTLSVIDALKKSGFEQTQLKVFDNGRVKTMLFVNEGTETVETQKGKLETIRVRSNALGGGTRHTTTWFAPELGYVPVKMEQYKRDKLVARLKLTKLRNHITEAGGAKNYSLK